MNAGVLMTQLHVLSNLGEFRLVKSKQTKKRKKENVPCGSGMKTVKYDSHWLQNIKKIYKYLFVVVLLKVWQRI